MCAFTLRKSPPLTPKGGAPSSHEPLPGSTGHDAIMPRARALRRADREQSLGLPPAWGCCLHIPRVRSRMCAFTLRKSPPLTPKGGAPSSHEPLLGSTGHDAIMPRARALRRGNGEYSGIPRLHSESARERAAHGRSLCLARSHGFRVRAPQARNVYVDLPVAPPSHSALRYRAASV
jgi:hypothetical protein